MKRFSFLPVSFLFEIYREKRKTFHIYNSIIRIQSVVGTFWMHCPSHVRTCADHSIKCSQISFSIKKVPPIFPIRMLKIAAL